MHFGLLEDPPFYAGWIAPTMVHSISEFCAVSMVLIGGIPIWF